MKTIIVALANQKGGVGKTTTAINLAAALTALRKKVLLLDLDPQANATSGLGLPKESGASIYQVLIGQAELKDKIQATAYARLDMVPSEVDLAGAEIDVARSDRYLHRVHESVAPLADTGVYDFILIDCPPSLGILTMNALTAAHQIVVPMQCEYYALEGLSVMLRLIDELSGSGANPNLALEGIVMTMYDSRTNLAQQVVREVYEHFGDKVYETLIPRSVRLGEAPSHGRPIIDYEPRSTGSLAYKQLAWEFLKRRNMRGYEEKETVKRKRPNPKKVPTDSGSEQTDKAPAPSPAPEPAPVRFIFPGASLPEVD